MFVIMRSNRAVCNTNSDYRVCILICITSLNTSLSWIFSKPSKRALSHTSTSCWICKCSPVCTAWTMINTCVGLIICVKIRSWWTFIHTKIWIIISIVTERTNISAYTTVSITKIIMNRTITDAKTSCCVLCKKVNRTMVNTVHCV